MKIRMYMLIYFFIVYNLYSTSFSQTGEFTKHFQNIVFNGDTLELNLNKCDNFVQVILDELSEDNYEIILNEINDVLEIIRNNEMNYYFEEKEMELNNLREHIIHLIENRNQEIKSIFIPGEKNTSNRSLVVHSLKKNEKARVYLDKGEKFVGYNATSFLIKEGKSQLLVKYPYVSYTMDIELNNNKLHIGKVEYHFSEDISPDLYDTYYLKSWIARMDNKTLFIINPNKSIKLTFPGNALIVEEEYFNDKKSFFAFSRKRFLDVTIEFIPSDGAYIEINNLSMYVSSPLKKTIRVYDDGIIHIVVKKDGYFPCAKQYTVRDNDTEIKIIFTLIKKK